MKKNIFKSIVILTLMTCFFCRCQTVQTKKWTSDDLIIRDQTPLEFPEHISEIQASEDIDFLVYALQNGYGGRKYVPNNLFLAGIASLKNISGAFAVEDFHDRLDGALFEIPDNHLVAYYKGKVSKKRREQERIGQVGRNNISNPEKIWETRIDRLGKKRGLYISVASFPEGDNKVWNDFIPSVTRLRRSADFIVIDLRGNGGGDDSKGMELAKVLFGHEFEHPIKKQYRSQTPETFAFNVNLLKVHMVNMEKQNLKVPDLLIKELSQAREKYREVVNGGLSPVDIRTNKGGGSRDTPITGFTKPIYILMDGACSSSCEFTIAAFEWHSSVKKVGENTNGTFHFSNAGMIVLPNSKIKVKIPTQYSEYFDHRFIERVGFSPDIKVLPGKDAYAALKKIIL